MPAALVFRRYCSPLAAGVGAQGMSPDVKHEARNNDRIVLLESFPSRLTTDSPVYNGKVAHHADTPCMPCTVTALIPKTMHTISTTRSGGQQLCRQ